MGRRAGRKQGGLLHPAESTGTKLIQDLRVTNNSAQTFGPSMVWTGNRYGIAWYDDHDGNHEIYFSLLDAAGSKIRDVRVTNDPAYSYEPSLVWNGSQFALAWRDYRTGQADIYFATLDSEGTKTSSDIRVTFANGSASNPSLVWTGSGYGVAWHDFRDGNPEIYLH